VWVAIAIAFSLPKAREYAVFPEREIELGSIAFPLWGELHPEPEPELER